MIYLYSYFLIGISILAGLLAFNRFTKPSDSSKIRQILYDSNFSGPDRHKLSTRILKIVVPILGSLFMIFTWPYWLLKGVLEKIQENSQNSDDEEEKVFAVNVTDLIKCVSVEEIEETERINDPMGAVPDIAFGFLNPMWEKFKTQLESEDEIWTYKATWKNDWQNQNRFGYAILRGEGVVHQLMINREEVEDSSDSG